MAEQHLKYQLRRRLAEFSSRRLPARGLRHAAVAIVVVPNGADTGADEDGVVLLTRRSSRLSSHKGQWALPGGRLDDGETPVDAALRETSEEIGLDIPEDNVLGLLDDYQTRSGYLMTPVVVWAGTNAQCTANPAEVESIHEVGFEELNRPDSPVFVEIPESERPVIRLRYQEHFVHAPTAAVVYQFREVCLHGRHTRVAHFEQPVFAWR